MALRKLKLRATKPVANVCTIPTYGNPKAPVMLVLDPLIGPLKSKVPISVKHFKFLGSFLKQAGISKDQLYLVGACPPVSEQTWGRDKELGAHLKEHRQGLLDIIDHAKPKLIVAMGKCAARQVVGRSVQITKMRGLPFKDEALGRMVMPTLGVLHVARQPENKDVWAADWATTARIINSGFSIKYTEKTPTKYEWCDDISDLLKHPPEELSVDTETVGTRPYDPNTRILTVQLTSKAGHALVLPIDYNPYDENGKPYVAAGAAKWKPNRPVDPKRLARLKSQLKKLLENPNVKCFGHNFKFDWQMLYHRLGIKVANFADDTILLVHNVDENMLTKDLDESVRRWVPEMSGYADEFNRDPVHLQKSRMDLVPPHKMLAYGGGDSDGAFRLRATLLDTLRKDKKAYNCYRNVPLPAMAAFAEIEETGFAIDEKELDAFAVMLRKHQASEKQRLEKMVPGEIRSAFEAKDKFKLTNPEFLRAMLFTHKKGLRLKPIVFTNSTKDYKGEEAHKRVPSVSTKQHLPYFDGYPFVDGIKDYIKNDKLLNTYVGKRYDEKANGPTGFYKYIVDGCIRPSYLLHGTVTGRTSSKDPNGQNFPKHGKFAKQYRKIFRAPPGYVLIEADFSQIELRVAAILANEPTMLKLYAEGADIHSATAAHIMGLTLAEFNKLDPEVRAHKRFQAKAVNFGFLYGMGWRKFRSYAKTDYGIDFTDEEAEKIRNSFFGLYRRLPRWHDEVQRFVSQHGFVRALDGRVRHLTAVFSEDEKIQHSAMRQGVNSPVQGFANDLGLMAVARINKNVPKDLVRIIGFIHDAIVCIAPIDRAVEAARTVKRYMESNPLDKWFGFTSPIPLIAEVSVGFNLAAMSEIKGAVDNKALVSLADYAATLKDDGERAKVTPPAGPSSVRATGLRRLRRKPVQRGIRRIRKVPRAA